MASAARDQGDPFDLARFTSAQDAVYDRALAEIRNGDKRSHWMWFIFPQIDGPLDGVTFRGRTKS